MVTQPGLEPETPRSIVHGANHCASHPSKSFELKVDFLSHALNVCVGFSFHS